MVACAVLAAPAKSGAQDRGAAALANALSFLRHDVPRVLMIGAHPDDEDARLLTWLARGGYADAAYLSLTRGDGGQNLIGSELGEALGVLRTQELLAARRIDGARQYFTRAYDFGYSKSADETFVHWPRDTLLGDVVRVVRAFRPHVIVAVFSGTPRDAHGQHQVSGILAREVYDAAADTVRFPVVEFGAPWTPHKFYRLARFATGRATLGVNVGEYDPLLGRSYAEVEAESRVQHKSQAYGPILRQGVAWDSLAREDSRVNSALPAREEYSLFDGLAAVMATSASPNAGRGRNGLEPSPLGLTVDFRHPESALPVIAEFQPRTPAEQRYRDRAAVIAAGVIVEEVAERDVVALGDSVKVTYRLHNRGHVRVRVLQGPSTNDANAPWAKWIAPDSSISWSGYRNASRVTDPWWLRRPRLGDMFGVPIFEREPTDSTSGGGASGGTGRVVTPSEQDREEASWSRFSLEIEGLGSPVEVRVRPMYRHLIDPIRGEVQRPLMFVPGLTVTPDRSNAIFRARVPATRVFEIGVRSEVTADRTVTVHVRPPAGLRVDTASRTIRIAAGETRVLRFAITGSLPPGEYRIAVDAESEGQRFDLAAQEIAYEHVPRQRIYRPAGISVSAIDVAVPAGLRVAYIPGGSDDLPDVLEELGIAVKVVQPRAIPTTDFSQFTTIVIGPRAYEAAPELVQHAPRLLDLVAAGKRMVVQYGQLEMPVAAMPYPIRLVRPPPPAQLPRVTDETAPVTVLDSAAAELNRPNRITVADFAGWIQDRALFMPTFFDPRYRGLLAMNDPGEPPNRGAILVTRVGRGSYVYTSLALFRQLRAGVPGATRLFVNLISPAAQ